MPPRSREHPPRRDRKDRLNAFHQRRNLIRCYRPAKKDNFVQPAEEFFAAEGAEKQFAGPVYIPFLRLGRLKCAINIDAHLLAIVKPNDVIPLFKFKLLVRADLYWRFVGGEPRSRALEETRFKEVIEGARLLASNRVDVWLDGNRLLYVKEGRCVGSEEEPEEPFFLHVVPLHQSDLPENRKEHGYDNLDFDIADIGLRLGISHRCVVARRLPDYAVASIRTGQFVESSFERLWEEEIRF